jgi:hypothetical protein
LKDKPTVHHVPQDVKPVPSTSLVKPVKLTLSELPHQNAHVLMDIMNSITSVTHVPHNVKLVLLAQLVVVPVLVTEKDQKMVVFVQVAFSIPMMNKITSMLVVENVNILVANVSEQLITVLNVAKMVQQEAQSQIAQSFHKVSIQLKSSISQLVLLESLIVTVNV